MLRIDLIIVFMRLIINDFLLGKRIWYSGS